MEVLKLSIGTNIKTLREQHNMSQEELGKIAGVTDKAVSTWENDIKIPRMGAIQRIADYFGIRKSDIIEDKNNNIDTPMPHQNLISKYEQEQREPKFEMLIAFANFFEVTTDFLLGVSTDTKTDKKDTSLINEVSMILCNFTEEELLDIKKYSNFLRWSRGH